MLIVEPSGTNFKGFLCKIEKNLSVDEIIVEPQPQRCLPRAQVSGIIEKQNPQMLKSSGKSTKRAKFMH